MLKACRASYGEELLPGLAAAFHQSHCQALAVCAWVLEVLIPCKEQQYCEISSWLTTLCPYPHSIFKAELRTARQSVFHSRGDQKSVTAVCLCKDMASV